MSKPLLIFDGDCGFCRRSVARWKHLTGDRVEYLPIETVIDRFPNVPRSEFERAVQLIEPDGRRSSGAEAVFRALAYGGSGGWLWIYHKIPGFAPLAEFAYSVVAGHRPIFSAFTRWFWGNPPEPPSHRQVRWLFLRALALIYGIAFWSLGMQLKGLMGADGILPARQLLGELARYGAARFWYVPTLAWMNSSDFFLVGMCVLGLVVSALLFVNVAPRLSLLALWLLYLSLVSVGGDFMNFQWDALLLETGFLAILFAPSGIFPQFRGSRSPAPPLVFLLRWLLFRLMLQSALVKWSSGDALWHSFTALTVHYQTQPLPNALSWLVHQGPLWFHKLSCVLMFGIEGFVPFLIFVPRRARIAGFWALMGFQALIFLTGNYTYFNLLAMALGLSLLDDAALRRWLPAWCGEPVSDVIPAQAGIQHGYKRWVPAFARMTILFLTGVPFARVLGMRLPNWLEAPAVWASPLRSFNGYGLFAVMTPTRPEIILEGSNDQRNWLAYEFKYKPGDLARIPRQAAPHQPRLDWQMWFAALSDYRQNPWFVNFCVRILQGSPEVLSLLASNPFPDKPPAYLRASVYEYRFTTLEEHRRSGYWWHRDYKGLYCPVLSLKITR